MSATAQEHTSTQGRAPTQGHTLTGVGTLVRFMLRRDRVRIPVWLAALTLSALSTALSFPDLYPTAEDRQARAALFDSPAGIAMSGPGFGLDQYGFGAMLAHEMLGFLAIFVALMSVLLVIRHTRAEEEAGRAELVRAGVVGRHAQTAAALIVVAATNLVLAALLTVGLGGLGVDGVDWTGSLAFAAGLAGVGLVFAVVAALTAQVSEHARGASGMALAAIGLAFALRAAGDIGNGALSWLSPIGWAQRMRPYVDERWWPLALFLGLTIALGATAFALSVHRDVGAGLRQPRPGRASGSAALATPIGFALRLQRAGLVAWCVGMFVFGLVYGSILSEVTAFAEENTTVQEAIAEIGGDTVIDSFLTMVVSILATVTAVYGILAVQRMRSEETAGRAEPVLATALSRVRWAGGHIFIALAGSAAIVVASALGLGLSGAASLDDFGVLSDVLGAALAYLPAIWISAALAVALFGLAPRAVGLAWAVLVYGVVVTMFGALFQFPDWMNELSPFGHVPGLPAEEFTAVPLVVLTVVTVGLVWVGTAAFRRRDLTMS